MKRPLTRKETAPRNLAAKALGAGHFKPKVEPDPKTYKRKGRYRPDPLAESDRE
jgi:hypothetical protein